MRISDGSSDVCSSDLIDLVRGTLGFAGRSFDLEEGKVTFPTGDAYDPSIQLLATDTIETVTVNVNVSGRAMNPQVTFSSVPGLPQDEIDRKSTRLNSSH